MKRSSYQRSVAKTRDIVQRACARVAAQDGKHQAADFKIWALIDSLNSCVCPACARRKKERQVVCFDCFMKLPPSLRTEIVERTTETFPGVFAEAMNFLKVETLKV
jgi:hypothetical protein